MKVAQIVCVFPPYKGGIGNVAYHYAKQLSKLGHDVTVFTPQREKDEGNSYNFKIQRMRSFLRIGNAALLPQLLWKLKGFDVVHLHYPFLGAGLFVYLLKLVKKDKLNLVMTYHMDLIGSIGTKQRIFDLHSKHLMPSIVRSADKILVSSYDYVETSKIADIYEKNQEKFAELPFGVDETFRPQEKKNDLLKKYGINRENIVLLFVGGLDKAHYFKGLDKLLQAVKKIDNPNLKLIIVGRGDLESEYKTTAKNLNIRHQVFFTGYLPDEQLPDYYNLCDIFVLPSTDRSEAFGIVLIEAMACAKSVVASNLKGVRKVVDIGQTGCLVEPGNVDDLVQKIQYLIDNPDWRAKFGKNGYQKVQEKYLWDKVGVLLEKEYLGSFSHQKLDRL